MFNKYSIIYNYHLVEAMDKTYMSISEMKTIISADGETPIEWIAPKNVKPNQPILPPIGVIQSSSSLPTTTTATEASAAATITKPTKSRKPAVKKEDKIAVEAYHLDTKQRLRVFLNVKDAANKLGLTQLGILETCHGKRSNCGTLGWRFFEGTDYSGNTHQISDIYYQFI